MAKNAKSFKLSIVTPVYNEEKSIAPLISSLSLILSKITPTYEIIFCLDPSTDATEKNIRKLAEQDNRIKLLAFNRRVGQDIAVLAGIEFAQGDAIVIMDCDLQDPPFAISEMVVRWQAGAKTVIGKRISRESDSRAKKFSSRVFNRFLNKYSKIPFPANTGDFRLIDKSIANEVNRFREANPFTKGVMAWVGSNYDIVEFERPDRFAGETKYNRFLGGYQIAFAGIISYSNILLKVSLFLGIGITSLSFLAGATTFLLGVFNSNLQIAQYFIVILFSFLGGTILISLGILGLYVDRIFDEVKHRPRYTVREFLNG